MQPACKPDSVPAQVSAREIWTGFHHLSCHAITCVIIRPTPRRRTSNPNYRYTWSFNPSGVRHPVLPQEPVSSYLAFSPFPRHFGQGGYFLLHYYTLTDIFPLGSMVLCVVRTFLSACRRNDGTARCNAKIHNHGESLKLLLLAGIINGAKP